MLKIANVIEDARISGPQLRILAVSQALQERDIWTTVVHPIEESEEFVRRLERAGIAHAAIPIRRLTRVKSGLLRYITLFPADIYHLWRFFYENEFDFVHCSGGYWQVKGLIAAKLAGRKVIWHLNDTVMPTRLRKLFLLASRTLVSGLIFAGKSVRDHYLAGATIRTPQFEIQAPVSCAEFDPNTKSMDAKLANYGGIKIVTISNPNPLKGLEYFLQMADILQRDFNNVTFHIIGHLLSSQSEYISVLKSLVEKKELHTLHFHGPSYNIPSILKAADIYVCSSIAEASPMSVWEAMAMGKAIVSTDVGDVARFIKDGYSGFVVPARNPAALARSVAEFIQDPTLRQTCGDAARRTAIRFLDIEKCVEDHERVYLSLSTPQLAA